MAKLCLNLKQENEKNINLVTICFLGFTKSLQQTMEALGLFLAREAEKTVSTWKVHSQHLIFITCCGCTQGGAEDRKSTDPEEGSHEL